MEKKRRIPRGYYGGGIYKTNQGAHTNVYVGPRAHSKEELLLGQVRPRTKGTACIENDTPDYSME